jgi:uracil-DNA glycosylase family 4
MRFVPPGTGWPEDPATAATPVAGDPAQVRALASSAESLQELAARESVCRACPRLVSWREDVAVTRRRQFAGERYWGRPVPGWGDPDPWLLIVGLAPAAHGGNRTGRIFTGDRSGDFLFASLHRCGLATQADSIHVGDGLHLTGARMSASVRCAPPANKPTPAERDACAPWLVRELRLMSLSVIVCLGGFAWQALWPSLEAAGYQVPRRRPAFTHGASAVLEPGGVLLLGCYHPSQQNTFTGRVTPAMMDDIFHRSIEYASERDKRANATLRDGCEWGLARKRQVGHAHHKRQETLEVPMALTHSPDMHKSLLARIPFVTGRDLAEWFRHLESGPAFLRCEERAAWLADEHNISHGYANAIVHEYEVRRRLRLFGC